MTKFYVVKKGKQTGIFETWTECQAVIQGVKGAEYKSFMSKSEAEAYLEDKDVWVEQVQRDNQAGYLVAFTDGSYDKNLNRYSCGVQLIKPNGEEENIRWFGSNEKYLSEKNVTGEVFGVINALDWAISNNYYKIKIYHDYEGLNKWLTGEWTAKSNVAKMYTNLFNSKFRTLLQVEFIKIKGHSNIIYNNKADALARMALNDKQKIAIKGDSWFEIPYFNEKDLVFITKKIQELYTNIIVKVDTSQSTKTIYRFKNNGEKVTVSFYKTGTLLFQGKNSYLFQALISLIVELCDNIKIEDILSSAYRVSIDKENIANNYGLIESKLPQNYPYEIKKLVKQSIINMNYNAIDEIDFEDYSMYTLPAFRTLEGHIKYLINQVGVKITQNFNCFNKDKNNEYIFVAPISDLSKKTSIEICYNFYKLHRDTLFHYGDISNSNFGNTRFVSSKQEANDLIQKCVDLISTK